MATLDFVNYHTGNTLGRPPIEGVRVLEEYVDFSLAGNQLAAATDNLALFELPAGSIVFAAGIEQVTVSDETTNTLAARIGTTALSDTLAGDDAVGTVTAHVDVSGGAPVILAAAADFNLLSATAIRLTGKVRAFAVVILGTRVTGYPALAARDATTGLA